jgi:GWxTD domain-containing protein
MKRSRIVAFSSILVLVATGAIAADSVADLFARVKTEFSQGDYKRSLADVDALDKASQAPGAEKDRPKLISAISFYRAANLAALGRADDAKEEFINFLLYSPNVSIKSPPFPPAVVDAFQKAQKGASGRSNGLAVKYASFAVPAGWTFPADTQWALSPVRYLLTNDQKKEYAALTTAADREAFVANFWKSFDPSPGTDPNEFRTEFERRVAFADANFATDKLPGRETDRGLVFTFLGIPTYVGASRVTADADAIAALRSGGGTGTTHGTSHFADIRTTSNNDDLESPDARGRREVWYYRQARLPAGSPFQEVKFEFITKEGYGTGVLQKESNVLQTLSQATDNARKIRKLN